MGRAPFLVSLEMVAFCYTLGFVKARCNDDGDRFDDKNSQLEHRIYQAAMVGVGWTWTQTWRSCRRPALRRLKSPTECRSTHTDTG